MLTPSFESTSKLWQAINNHGWKNWWLMLFKEAKEISEHVLPMVVLENEGLPNGKVIQEIINWSKELPDWVILRLSNPADWDWQVWTMPASVVIEDISDLQNTIDNIWSQHNSQSDKLIEYWKKEWISYDPTKTTLSISPYVKWTQITITEHPNYGLWEMIHVDLARVYGDKRYVDPYNVKSWLLYSPSYEEDKEAIDVSINLIRKIRETWCMPDTRAYQFESVYANGKIYLVQARDFGIWKLYNNEMLNDRIYWAINATEQYVVELLHNNALIWQSSLTDTIKKRALLVLSNTNKNIWTIYPDSNDMAYILPWWRCNSALSHQNTRFVKAMLQRWGMANLSDLSSGLSDLSSDSAKIKHWDVINFSPSWEINTINNKTFSLADLNLPHPNEIFK